MPGVAVVESAAAGIAVGFGVEPKPEWQNIGWVASIVPISHYLMWLPTVHFY